MYGGFVHEDELIELSEKLNRVNNIILNVPSAEKLNSSRVLHQIRDDIKDSIEWLSQFRD